MSEFIYAELSATCASLGFDNGATYNLDARCSDVIKDLIRYLKRDDDSHIVRRYLGRANLLQSDIVKIFVQYSSDVQLWDLILRLLINLTSPAVMVYCNEELPSEKTSRSVYQELVGYLQAYKLALADERVWSVVAERLKKILNLTPTTRGEENELVIERIFVLIRNVLQVPANENEKRADNDASVHDEVLFALHSSGLVDMLLFVASSSAEQQYHIQLLEIVALMLRDQSPGKLASVGARGSNVEKESQLAALANMREKEVLQKMERMKKYAGSRHARFGGTYVVENMKAIGDNQLICHKPCRKIEALDFNREKVKVKKPRNKVPILDMPVERTSALSVRLFLKEFSVEFLIGAYNPVMRHARSCISTGSDHVANIDPSHYLWTLAFFMEFNRRYKFEVKYVSETISSEMFHLVQRQLENCSDMMITDKKKIPMWAKRLHLALRAYEQLLQTLIAMDNDVNDEDVRRSSNIIKSNIFYVPEYRETIYSQLVFYDPLILSRSYLVDLVTTAHTFLKMLEKFCQDNRSIVVQKKLRKSKKHQKTGTQKKSAAAKSNVVQEEQLVELWDDAAHEISAVLQQPTVEELVPFDATLETPIDDQKGDAMRKIQKLLRAKKFPEAVGMLRASRHVWPENDCFGKPDISLEGEFDALREIMFANLGTDEPESRGQDRQEDHENRRNSQEIEDDEMEAAAAAVQEEEEEDAREPQFEETNFNFEQFLRKFANVKIVKAMALLLHNFNENTNQVNHFVVKMLHRIAWDCKMPGMMFQASMFRTFQKILESKFAPHKELQQFAIFIIRQFTIVAQKNRKAYMELLFWKATKEATDMVDGYNDAEVSDKVSRAVWTEAEEDELRALFMEHRTNAYSQDLIDWLLENIISDNRTRRGIIKKLKELSLIVDSKSIRKEVQNRLPKEWSEEEMAQLTEIWERVKGDADPIDIIHGALRIKRPKKSIRERLLESGLAQDRKEFRKKRVKDSDHVKASWETKSASEYSDTSEDSDNEERTKSGKSSSGVVATGGNQSQNRKERVKKPKKQPSIVYTDAQLSGLFKNVIDNDMAEALEWLAESLEDTMEDRDEESSEDIPLVPLSENISDALETPSYQRLLRAIGIEPPVSEEGEIYWRVPSAMLGFMIRKRCDQIRNALSGNLTVTEESTSTELPDNRQVEETNVPSESESESRSAMEIVSDFNEQIKRDRSGDSDSDVPTSKKRRVIDSDDEVSVSEKSVEKVAKTRLRIESDDDQEED